MVRKYVPVYEGNLRKHTLSVPRCISECSGIRVFGRRIKSLVFSTDVAIIGISEVPVFCGVGGGLTNGVRSASMAAYVEHQGAYGVVCNSKIGLDTIRAIKEAVEIPVVYTVISEKMDIEPYLAAGVDFVNVSGAARTPEIVAALRAKYPELPIIATGGPTDESITATIRAGANAITYTPPSSASLFAKTMADNRSELE